MKFMNPSNSENPIDMSKVAFDTPYRWGGVAFPGFTNQLFTPEELHRAPEAKPNPDYTNVAAYDALPMYQASSMGDARERYYRQLAAYQAQLQYEAEQCPELAFRSMQMQKQAPTDGNGKRKWAEEISPFFVPFAVMIAAIALGFLMAHHMGRNKK